MCDKNGKFQGRRCLLHTRGIPEYDCLRHSFRFRCSVSAELRIVPRLRIEPIFKHQLEQWLHSDAADRLHLRCCSSQKITESRSPLLCSDLSRKHALEPSPASQKVDTIFNFLPSVQILIHYNACMCLKTC